MKKIVLFFLLYLLFKTAVFGQIICIFCYDQNDSISDNVHNLVLNGGFENSNCALGQGYYCPASANYNCNIANWVCTGGGSGTYAQMFSSNNSIIVEGIRAAYMGNFFCMPCSGVNDDTSCVVRDSCRAKGFPPGYPDNTPNYGGNTGISLEQNVSGLLPGRIYIMEFWIGGEDGFPYQGVFGLDVGFGQQIYSNKPTAPNSQDIGTRFIVEFRATSATHKLKFTNWGHICSSCTEAVIDNVRLYPLADVSPTVPLCDTTKYIIGGPPPDLTPPVVVTVPEKDSLYIPNVFSPNGNNPNDLFKVYYRGSKEYKIDIYNRWGGLVFNSNDKTIHWDGKMNGKDAPDGTYYYLLSIGESRYKGFLTLVR